MPGPELSCPPLHCRRSANAVAGNSDYWANRSFYELSLHPGHGQDRAQIERGLKANRLSRFFPWRVIMHLSGLGYFGLVGVFHAAPIAIQKN
jgi:hypothetical protein